MPPFHPVVILVPTAKSKVCIPFIDVALPGRAGGVACFVARPARIGRVDAVYLTLTSALDHDSRANVVYARFAQQVIAAATEAIGRLVEVHETICVDRAARRDPVVGILFGRSPAPAALFCASQNHAAGEPRCPALFEARDRVATRIGSSTSGENLGWARVHGRAVNVRAHWLDPVRLGAPGAQRGRVADAVVLEEVEAGAALAAIPQVAPAEFDWARGFEVVKAVGHAGHKSASRGGHDRASRVLLHVELVLSAARVGAGLDPRVCHSLPHRSRH
mmetsp:Transcript_8135/g.26816  ORF Transcript_8135/g.26816 Transcript_8135/m.26816 type:complete len:276 (-) Transcript_8135:688-1515(-)